MTKEQIQDVYHTGDSIHEEEEPHKRDVKVTAIRRHEGELYRVTFLSDYSWGADWDTATIERVEEYTETITVTKYRANTGET